MSLIYIDGFESYDSATDLAHRWGYTGADTGQASFPIGRHGSGKALRILSQFEITRELNSANVVFFGMAVNFETLVGSDPVFIQLIEDNTFQCFVGLNKDTRQIEVGRSNTTVIETSTNTLDLNRWYYIEGKMTITNSCSTNDVIVNVDGEEWVNATAGGDFQQTANAYVNSYTVGKATSSTVNYDDFYILNDSGATHNTFLGPNTHIITLRPDGEGNVNDFTGSDADSTNNHLHVDDVTPDGDTSYVESSTVDHTDLYTIDNVGLEIASVDAIQIGVNVKKTAAGSRTGRPIIRTNSVNLEGDIFYPSAASYLGFEYIWEQNLDTTAAWTESDLNNLEIGLTVEA